MISTKSNFKTASEAFDYMYIKIKNKGVSKYINNAEKLWAIWEKLGSINSLLQPLSKGKIPVNIVPNP